MRLLLLLFLVSGCMLVENTSKKNISSSSKSLAQTQTSSAVITSFKEIEFIGPHTKGLKMSVPSNTTYNPARVDIVSFYSEDEELINILHFGDSSLSKNDIDRSRQLYPGKCPGPEDYSIVKTIETKNLLVHEIDYPCEKVEAPTYMVEREYGGKTEYLKVQMVNKIGIQLLETYLFTLHTI